MWCSGADERNARRRRHNALPVAIFRVGRQQILPRAFDLYITFGACTSDRCNTVEPEDAEGTRGCQGHHRYSLTL
jgi:hypothetical protein